MSLFLTLSATVCAYAEEGFLGGLQTLVDPDSAQEIEYDPVRDYEYVPTDVRVDVPVHVMREYDENSTAVDYVNGTLDSFNTINWFGTDGTLLGGLKALLGYNFPTGRLIMGSTVAMVFLWWGVRKSIGTIVKAWKGKKLAV